MSRLLDKGYEMRKKSNGRLFAFVVALTILLCVIAGCAPKTAESLSSEDEDSGTVVPAWSADSDCTTCHKADQGETLCSIHETAGSAQCYDCHSLSDMETLHADIDEKAMLRLDNLTALMNTAVADKSCLTCHDESELPTLLKEDVFLVDANGTAVNPHDVPETPAHERAVTCVSCHVVHKPVGASDIASKACAKCHHADVYECGTCHESSMTSE